MKYEDPIYGIVEFNGLEEEVIKNPGVQRLKKVHQNGADYLVNPNIDTSRFEHSLGVAILCKRFGCDKDEIIAALVHDISHTAFSHLVDQLYKRKDQAFHEDHHRRFIEEYGLDELVKKHEYDPGYIFDEDNFTVLERDVPDLCADRLDYMLRDLYKYGFIGKKEIVGILRGLTVEDGIIVAKNKECARKVMDMFMQLNREIFFDKMNEAAAMLLKEVLERAMDKDIIVEEDLFSHDERVLEKVREDEELSRKLDRITPEIEVSTGAEDDRYEVIRKHRVVDPPVKGTGKRLTELDGEARKKLKRFKEEVPLRRRYSIKTEPFNS